MPSWRREGRRQAGRGAQGNGSCSDPGREGGCFPKIPSPIKKAPGAAPAEPGAPKARGPLARAGWGAPGVVLLQGEGLGHGEGPPLVPARGTAPSAARKKCKTQPSVKLPPTPGACPHHPVPRDGDSHRAAGEHQEMPRQQLPTLLSSWGTTTGGQTSKKGKKGRGHGSQLHRLGFFCSCSGSSAPAVPGSYARLASNPQQNLCCHSHDRQETHAHGCTLTGNLLRTLRRATLRKETKTQLGRGGEEDLS